MAAGDIAYNTAPVGVAGNVHVIHGTIEVDDTYRAFALASTKSYIVHCMLQDEDGAGAMECDLNVNASGTVTNGTIAVVGNHASTNTVRFRAEVR